MCGDLTAGGTAALLDDHARYRKLEGDPADTGLVDQVSGQPYAYGMVSFNIYDAKTQLSKLIRRVRAGEEIVIADAGTPVAKLVPIEQPKIARTLGGDRGKIWVAPDAFDPLAGADLAPWEGALFPDSSSQQRPPKARPVRRRSARRGKRR